MLHFPWNIQFHESLDSTNRLALASIHSYWEKNRSPHALVIVAEKQTAGRGQHGRTWESPPGGLYLSVIVEHLLPDRRDKLALIAGVAVATALRKATQIKVSLRWPNDIILAGKKLGGILCEAAAEGDRWAGVIGIGLNINTHLGELPKSLQRTATSLFDHDGNHHDPRQIEKSVLDELAQTLQIAYEEGLLPIIEKARKMDTLRGTTIEIEDAGKTHTGTAAGLGDSGELLLQTPTGIHPFPTGTILSINGTLLRP
jgi:BirA family biotin operon repressor/biotin-[acetyl-CoA-carboxylase] ligase